MSSIGIDLGTTTTLIAEAYSGFDSEVLETRILRTKQKQWDGNKAEDIEADLLPSFAYFPQSGEELVGTEALTRSERDHDLDRCVRAVKRLMGRSLILPAPINHTPAYISSLYLQHVIQHAKQSSLLNDRDELTVTVPASFTTNQRRDTLHALETALIKCGLKLKPDLASRALISEPVAALLAYLNDEMRKTERRINLDANPRVLVYDMGGGTLDLTIVQLGWRDQRQPRDLGNIRFEILELNRYNQFAGEDFDKKVARHLLDKVIQLQPDFGARDLTQAETQYVRYKLVSEAERLKREIGEEMELFGADASIPFSFRKPISLPGKDYRLNDWTITLANYLEWTKDYLEYREDQQNALFPIEALLKRANLQLADIHYFLHVGGMARFTPLRKALTKYWLKDKNKEESSFIYHPFPDHAVALGASVYSELKANSPEFRIEEPSADAYYVRRQSSFGLLLGRGYQAKGEKREYKTTSEGSKLLLQVFAGEMLPADGKVESVIPSLVYQGGSAIPLGKTYPKGTKIWIQMSYRENDNSKVPYLDIWVDSPDKLFKSISYSDISE